MYIIYTTTTTTTTTKVYNIYINRSMQTFKYVYIVYTSMGELVMISARIRKEDKEFLKAHDIGITELITTAIFHRKNEFEGFATNFTAEREKREKFQKKFSDALSFMEENGLLDNFISKENFKQKMGEKNGN